MNKKNSRPILVLLVALGLRLMLFLAIGPWRQEVVETRILAGDPVWYNEIALNLANHGVFSRSALPPYRPDIFITPAYPLFLASVYKTSGYQPFLAILVQLVMSSAVCLLIYKIGRTVFNEKTAFLAGLFGAFEYSSIAYSNILFTETLFTLFFIIEIYFLLKFLQVGDLRHLAFAAIFLGLSTLTRPVSAYFFVFLIPVFLVHFRKSWRRAISSLLAFVLVFFMSVVPWMARNYMVSGKFLISSAQEEVIGWIFLSLHRSLDPGHARPGLAKDKAAGGSKPEFVSDSGRASVVRAIVSDASRYLRGTARFFLTPGSSTYPRLLGLPYSELNNNILRKKPLEMLKLSFQSKHVYEIFAFVFCLGFLLFLYLAMLPGVVMSSRDNKPAALLLICVIIYFAMAAGSFTVTERYRVPIMPFVILLSCRGLVGLQQAWSERAKRRRMTEPASTDGWAQR
jgi:4-amino-4-deoxy-L-arabinose transferase-like glycosyltransferase